MRAYPAGTDSDVKHDVQQRLLLCLYLATCTNTFAARKEKVLDRKHEWLRAVCLEAMQFRHALQVIDRSSSGSQSIPEPMLTKLAAVLIFEFEAQVQLNSWVDLNSLIETANTYRLSSLVINCMADLILSSSAPSDATFSIMSALTDASLGSKDCDIPRVSRWFRMLFTLSLTRDAKTLDNLAIKLLQIIRDNLKSYPVDEIQWLAAKAFNHAVDIHGTGDVDRCHRMCEIALNIGNYAQDDNLKHQIQTNYQQIIASLQGSA